jgi:hypothetical protein
MNDMAVVENRPLTAVEIRTQVNLIQEVMKAVMKKDTHYGVIPGCQKPSLWKPGAEKLLATFRVASETVVEDLSTGDEARYRVTRKGLSNGTFIGSGVGECSSSEEKYKWRGVVCDAEFDDTPEDRRRLKYKRDGTTTKQIRTNPADVANTVLKMADKRAYVALALNVTAASDIFTQDIEDLPAEIVETVAGAEPARAHIKGPEAKTDAPQSADVVTFVPTVVNAKTWTKGDKSGTSYSVKLPDGGWASTFDSGLAEILTTAKEAGSRVAVQLVKKGAFTNVVSVTPVE